MNELSREELLEKICPTDATNDCCQGNCSCSCDKCDDVLNYLLDRYDAKVKADAIQEFVKSIEKNQTMQDNYFDAPRFEMSVDMTDILKIAEQLKEGLINDEVD